MITKIRNLIRTMVISLSYFIYKSIYGMDIARSARISVGAKLDKTYPQGLHIGEESYVASGAIIFTHDYCRGIHTHTKIGEKCFIGANAIIMPGLNVGNQVVVGG